MAQTEIASARLVALEALWQILKRDEAKADEVLDTLFRRAELSAKDAALAFELTYGVLRNLNLLDYCLEPLLFRTLKHTPMAVLNVLRLAVYQKLRLERVPDYAIVNESVNLARQKIGASAAHMVNAVLRRFLDEGRKRSLPDEKRNPLKYYEMAYSYPGWLIQSLRQKFGDAEARDFMAACNQAAPLDLRVNVLKTGPEALQQRLREAGFVGVTPMRYSPVGLRLTDVRVGELVKSGILEEGLTTIQDEAAQLIGFLLSPAPGQQIIDYCAAPGGKTTHLAELSRDAAEIIACDINPARLRVVEENCRRLGLKSVKCLLLDDNGLKDLQQHKADAVLVDAPCTALGTLRRHPELRWKRCARSAARLAQLQLQICENALQLLKPAGVFVYSVCTFTTEETVGVVQELLKRHPRLNAEAVVNYLPRQAEEITTSSGFLGTYPQRHQTDAFFAARFCLLEAFP